MVKENIDWCDSRIRSLFTKGAMGKARAWEEWAEVMIDGKWVVIDYTEPEFKEQFDNLLREGGWI